MNIPEKGDKKFRVNVAGITQTTEIPSSPKGDSA